MSAYVIISSSESQQTPALKKGPVKISTDKSIYWTVGENPVVVPGKSAFLRSDESIEINLPVKCSKIAVMAVTEPGTVTILEQSNKISPSCS